MENKVYIEDHQLTTLNLFADLKWRMPEFDHYLFGKKRTEKELFGRCIVKSHAFSAWRLSNLITLVFINPARNVMRQFIYCCNTDELVPVFARIKP